MRPSRLHGCPVSNDCPWLATFHMRHHTSPHTITRRHASPVATRHYTLPRIITLPHIAMRHHTLPCHNTSCVIRRRQASPYVTTHQALPHIIRHCYASSLVDSRHHTSLYVNTPSRRHVSSSPTHHCTSPDVTSLYVTSPYIATSRLALRHHVSPCVTLIKHHHFATRHC